MNLQELFIQSEGAPLTILGRTVVQMDKIPIKVGRIALTFETECYGQFGVALKSAKGGIELSDGRIVPLLHIWNDPELDSCTFHKVNCPDKELRVWNIYRTEHPNGSITEDSWTGNAGMIVDQIGPHQRRYNCSSGPGGFDPRELVFSISWEEI